MPEGPINPREFGYLISVAQVGLEMAAMIGIGLGVDYLLGCPPWGVVGGAVFGLVAGVSHLALLMNRRDDSGSAKQPRDGP